MQGKKPLGQLSCNLALVPKRRVHHQRHSAPHRNVTTCFGGYSAAAFDSPSVITLLGQVASAAAWAAVAYLGYQLKLQQVSRHDAVLLHSVDTQHPSQKSIKSNPL